MEPDEDDDNFGGNTPGTALGLPPDIDLLSDGCSLDLPSLVLESQVESIAGLETDLEDIHTFCPLPSNPPEFLDQHFVLKNLDAMVNEAHMQNGIQCNLKMPWECGVMAGIFGSSSLPLLPKVETPIGCIDVPIRRDNTSASKGSVEISTKTVFENCVKFNMARTKLDSEEAQWDVVMQRWESIIMHAPEHSKTGRYLLGLSSDMKKLAVGNVFRGKGISTLRKRADEFKKFAEWFYGAFGPPKGRACNRGGDGGTDGGARIFPLNVDDTRLYFNHLMTVDAPRTRYSGWLECCGFLEHVVGIDVVDEIHLDPVVKGVLRGLDATRKRRVQSRPFLVSEIEALELFLASSDNALVDRYICGGILFAVFARARFGDLRVVEQYCEDIPIECPENGFIELHSASHKMRRKGDSLGLALPLVAPVRGLTKSLCGLQFIQVAKDVGLPLGGRVRGPLLPAPTTSGDWTDRSLDNVEIDRWFKEVLGRSGSGDFSRLTPRSGKATLLSMLAKFGATPYTRTSQHEITWCSRGVFSRLTGRSPARPPPND